MKSKLHEFIVVGVGIVLSVFILVPSNVTLKLFTKPQSTKTTMNNNVSTTQGVNDIKKLEQKNIADICGEFTVCQALCKVFLLI